MSELSLANRLTPDNYAADPFAHYSVTQALAPSAYQELVAGYPDNASILQGKEAGDNRRFSWSAADALASPTLSPLWRRFVETHISQAFLDGVLRALAPDIRKRYPELERRMGPLSGWRVGLRKRDSFANADVLLDAQICINTPVSSAPSSVRGPHVDKPNKLFAGLFYLRPDSDTDTRGGELELYRYSGESAAFDGAELEPRHVELAKRVPYGGNTFVLFLNSLDALHGVTPRAVTTNTRYFFNLVGEIQEPLFDLKVRQSRGRVLKRLLNRAKDFLRGRRSASGQRWD